MCSRLLLAHAVSAILSLSLLGMSPSAAAQSDKAPAKTSAKSYRDSAQARNKALLAFQRDLVSVLAVRAEPMPLLGAALLARPLQEQPKVTDFHTLITRAAKAPDAGPAVDWIRLADCDRAAQACPNADALKALTRQAGDNAAVWVLELGQEIRKGDSDAARKDLARAAGAKLYDDYMGVSLKALATSVGTLPPPKAVIDPASGAGAAGVQVVLAYSIAQTQPQPGLQAVAQLCDKAGDDTAIRADCLKLGHTLEWGSSPLGRSLGLHLRETLSDDSSEQASAQQARRNLIWQLQNFGQLSARAIADRSQAQHLLALARAGGTEMSVILKALRDAGLSITAPEGWEPPVRRDASDTSGNAG